MVSAPELSGLSFSHINFLPPIADEVSALVVDIGSSSLRAGYAGDDTPKAIIPTSYGYIKAADDGDFAMADVNDAEIAPKPKLAKSYIGQSGPSVWRSGMEVANPTKGGLSECKIPAI